MLATLLSWLRLRRFTVRPFPQPAPKRPRRKPILESERFEDRNTAGETWNVVLGTALFGTGVAWLQESLLGGGGGAVTPPGGAWDRPGWGNGDAPTQPLAWVQPAADTDAEEARPSSPPRDRPPAAFDDQLRQLRSGPLDDPFAGLFGTSAGDAGAQGVADLPAAAPEASGGGGGGGAAPDSVLPQARAAAPVAGVGTATAASAEDLLRSAGLFTPSPIGATSSPGVPSGTGLPPAPAPGNPAPPAAVPPPGVVLPAQGSPAQPSLVEAFAQVPLAFELSRARPTPRCGSWRAARATRYF